MSLDGFFNSLPVSVLVLIGQYTFLFLAITRTVSFTNTLKEAAKGALLIVFIFILSVIDSGSGITWYQAYTEATEMLPFLLLVLTPALAAFVFRDTLLPHSHEPLTLYMSIISLLITAPLTIGIMGYMQYLTFNMSSLFFLVGAIGLLGTLAYIYALVVDYTFSHKEHSKASRGILNTWYLICLTGTCAYATFPLLLDLFDGPSLESPLRALMAGYFGTQVFILALYLLYLIPIPGKHQSMRERWKETVEHFSKIALHFSVTQYHQVYIVFMITLGVFTTILFLIPYHAAQQYAHALIAATHIIAWYIPSGGATPVQPRPLQSSGVSAGSLPPSVLS